MSNYIGCKCPVCQQPFTETDDIVVCPECGAPYHRACYQKQGGCVYASKHGTSFEWKPDPAASQAAEAGRADSARYSDPQLACPVCGAPNPATGLFCENCGAPLRGTPDRRGPAAGQTPPPPYGGFGGQIPPQYGPGSGQQDPFAPNEPDYSNPFGAFQANFVPGGLRVDPDALVSDISVGMQQRVEILKMLYRDNEILIFDEPTAVLTPQEIDELMEIMRGFKKEGKSILFITHKLNEIMAVADRCTVLRKGKYVGVTDIANTNQEELSRMMVGRDVQLQVDKAPAHPGEVILDVQGVNVPSSTHKKSAVRDVSFQVRAGEIVCLAGIEGNGQTEFVYGLTGLEKVTKGTITFCGEDITHASYPRGPSQARPGAGLQPGEQHGAAALLAARVPEPWLHPQGQGAGVFRPSD